MKFQQSPDGSEEMLQRITPSNLDSSMVEIHCSMIINWQAYHHNYDPADKLSSTTTCFQWWLLTGQRQEIC